MKSRRVICLILSFVIIVVILFMIFYLVIPELVNAVTVIGTWIPDGIKWVEDWVEAYADKIPIIEDWFQSLNYNLEEAFTNIAKYVTTGIGGILCSTFTLVTSVGTKIMNFVIGLIVAIYILANKEKLSNQTKRVMEAYCKPKYIQRFHKLFLVADDTFSNFIVGQCTEAIILGSLCAVGMWAFRFPYALMVGTFVGATALIPIVGAYLGGFVG